MTYELYTYFRSSAAYRVRIALNLKEIDHTLTVVNLLTADHQQEAYKAVNPQGLVPALKLPDGRILSQSPAILSYLERTHTNLPLLPSDPFDAALIEQWCDVIACDIHPVNNLRVLKYLTGELKVSEADKIAWYQHWISLGFESLEGQIKAAPYCFGDKVTLADLYLIPQVYNALRFHQDMSNFPKIMSVYEACNKLDAFIAAAPEQQIG
jgi:maleylacetoacetate isomerase